jgi:hypothetical protein
VDNGLGCSSKPHTGAVASAQAPFDRYAFPSLRPFTPVLAREPLGVQVGLDQQPSLILADVSAGTEALVNQLDGCHPISELRVWAAERGTSSTELEWVLRVLDDAGLLSEGGRGSTTLNAGAAARGARIRLIGAGVLGKGVAELMLGSGVAVLHLVDNGPPDLDLYPHVGVVGNQAQALAASLGSSVTTRVLVANHWTKPEGVAPQLTVVAGDRLECDRVLADGLVRADQPHLFLRPRAGGVLVGPFVLPGQTACLRCTDLTRRDADPGWPGLLRQLLRIRMAVTPVFAAWAAGMATAQALSFLVGTAPETCGATIEISPTEPATRFRSWPMHPGCGCGWGATAQWDP